MFGDMKSKLLTCGHPGRRNYSPDHCRPVHQNGDILSEHDPINITGARVT